MLEEIACPCCGHKVKTNWQMLIYNLNEYGKLWDKREYIFRKNAIWQRQGYGIPMRKIVDIPIDFQEYLELKNRIALLISAI